MCGDGERIEGERQEGPDLEADLVSSQLGLPQPRRRGRTDEQRAAQSGGANQQSEAHLDQPEQCGRPGPEGHGEGPQRHDPVTSRT